MFDRYNPSYSIQSAGSRARLLRTATEESGTAATAAVVTLDPATAADLAAALTRLHRHRIVLLHIETEAHPGQVCQLRRAAIGAVLGTRHDVAPDVDAVAALAAPLSGAERRAVADEVGRLLDGTEDILVPVRLTDEFGGVRFVTLANGWLPEASDDELTGLVDPADDLADTALYEGLLAHLRGTDADIDEACDGDWVDVEVDTVALTAWLRRNRPQTAATLAEILAES